MNDIQKSTPVHPALQLAYLLGFSVISGVVLGIIGMFVYSIFYTNTPLIEVFSSNPDAQNITFLRILQIFSSFGTFIIGPLCFAKFQRYNVCNYYHFNRISHLNLLLLTFSIMLFGAPLLELIATTNKNMSLPDVFQNIEQWMRIKEVQAMELTKQLLKMDSLTDLAINILMIAVIPAIGEELLFRGGLQNIFYKWFNNAHISIWLTAIIFSIIHFQFFGFFPRMLLGALFGYLLLWSKNMWFPIFAHFLNNGMAVIMAYVLQKQGKNFDEIENMESFNVWGYVISLIITLFLLQVFYKQSKSNTKDF